MLRLTPWRRVVEFRTFRTETARLGLIDPAQANAQGNTDENRANRKAYQGEIDGVVQADQARFETFTADLKAFQAGVLPLILGTTLVGLLAGVATALYVATRYVTRPLSHVTSIMGRLAEGELTVEVPYAGEKNEIGAMAAAVQVFKDNAVNVTEMNEDERRGVVQAAHRTAMMGKLQGAFDEVVAPSLQGDFSKRVDANVS